MTETISGDMLYRILVKKDAVDAKCDQWATVLGHEGSCLFIKLNGTDELKTIDAKDVVGVGFGTIDSLSIFFNITGTRISGPAVCV